MFKHSCCWASNLSPSLVERLNQTLFFLIMFSYLSRLHVIVLIRLVGSFQAQNPREKSVVRGNNRASKGSKGWNEVRERFSLIICERLKVSEGCCRRVRVQHCQQWEKVLQIQRTANASGSSPFDSSSCQRRYSTGAEPGIKGDISPPCPTATLIPWLFKIRHTFHFQ